MQHTIIILQERRVHNVYCISLTCLYTYAGRGTYHDDELISLLLLLLLL